MPKVADPSTNYAKKARHKARPDKYEYKGEAQAKKPLRSSKRKRRRCGSVGKEDFHADNIDAERVTLKPGGEQFVFSRSKMSVPLAGHDLPDLTFTKMDFLSRPRSSTRREFTNVFTKQDRKDDGTNNKRKSHIQPDTDAEALQTRHMSAESDSCSVELSVPSRRASLVRTSRSSNGMTVTPCRMNEDSSWVRSKVDPRLEEHQPVCTSTDSATPVSWSISPPPRHSTQATSSSQQAVPFASGREQVEPGNVLPYVKAQVLRARDSPSDDVCDQLTQGLLQRRIWSDATSSRQGVPKEYQSLEDLKSISRERSRRRSLDDPSSKRSNPLHSRPHIRLRGPAEADAVHRPPPLYTDDIIRQKQQGPCFPQAMRQQLIRGDDELVHYDSELVLPNRLGSYELNEHSHVTQNNLVEQPQAPIAFMGSCQGHNLAIQQSDSSSAWVKITKTRLRQGMVDDMTYPYWNDEQQLDEFDLELLETAKMGKFRQGSLPFADLRHSNQGSSDWLRSHGQKADRASGITPTPVSFAINRFPEHSLSRIGTKSEEQVKEQNMVIDRPSLQHKNNESKFNPFRLSWMSL